MIASEQEVRLEPSSGKWEQLVGSRDPIVLKIAPEKVDVWRMRLEHVEKRAAQAVILRPVGFSCSAKERDKNLERADEVANVIRLAFGLSLPLGHSCRYRYTAYYLSEVAEAFWVAGQDKLFESWRNIRALDLDNSMLRIGLQHMLGLIEGVEHEYRAQVPVKEELARLNEALSGELRDLDRLYIASYGQYAQLLGRAPDSLRGEDAIEAEYFNRMEDILERYKLCVVFEPLTLGIVQCKVGIREEGKTTEIALPFVDHPFRVETSSPRASGSDTQDV
jgi:hypothetical protein